MSEQPTPPEEAAGPSFTSTPSTGGRAYQTGGNANIYEYHYHGSAVPTPAPAPAAAPTPTSASAPAPAPEQRKRGATALGWFLPPAAVLLVLALGAGGALLWIKMPLGSPTSRDTSAPVGAGNSTKPTMSDPSRDASPSGTTPSSATPSPGAPGAPTATVVVTPPSKPNGAASAAAPDPAANPADESNCRAWTKTSVTRVEARSCWRMEAGRVYMIAEWRSTSGSDVVDVFLWLEDAGKKVVYPKTGTPKATYGAQAQQAGTPARQWAEWEVLADLTRGARYEVCLSVNTKGSPTPKIEEAAVQGSQFGFTY